jgi:lipopolysaccharide biosynthesis glycosyltransferase
VIPLQAWREQNILQRFFDVMANEQDRIKWWDQDVLNITLRDRWQRLPIWCNVCEAVHRALPLSLIEPRAALIHYSGSSKPWNSYSPSPFTAQWDQGYEAVFKHPFNREALLPPPPPFRSRIKTAMRSRISGLIHGRR